MTTRPLDNITTVYNRKLEQIVSETYNYSHKDTSGRTHNGTTTIDDILKGPLLIDKNRNQAFTKAGTKHAPNDAFKLTKLGERYVELHGDGKTNPQYDKILELKGKIRGCIEVLHMNIAGNNVMRNYQNETITPGYPDTTSGFLNAYTPYAELMALYYYHKVMVVAYMYVVVAESALISTRKEYYQTQASNAQAAHAAADANAQAKGVQAQGAEAKLAEAQKELDGKNLQLAAWTKAVADHLNDACPRVGVPQATAATPDLGKQKLAEVVIGINKLVEENTILKDLLNTTVPALARLGISNI